MAALIYLLCALACAICFVMLWKAFMRSRYRILFWSALSFGGMTLNNALLVADRIALPAVDLSVPRLVLALVCLLLLVFGLVWGED
ncbi:DUF5985 family protein [Caenimonas koreensis]|uniref:Uncharacterized protein n=1 Tax=Caenimonas koreensis DSM 17982 TaxID=1121255 RepID=A0A844B7W3_9BURK|nr:DUF5985 family protein [Caenimonas koreensis]MRD47516.1 hypothetical protein [Caenimonas koreensis DSM 17982]